MMLRIAEDYETLRGAPNNGTRDVDDGSPSLAKASMAYQSHLDDPEYWRDRAEQVRALVDQVSNQKVRDALLRIVADYELLAFRAQERAKR